MRHEFCNKCMNLTKVENMGKVIINLYLMFCFIIIHLLESDVEDKFLQCSKKVYYFWINIKCLFPMILAIFFKHL